MSELSHQALSDLINKALDKGYEACAADALKAIKGLVAGEYTGYEVGVADSAEAVAALFLEGPHAGTKFFVCRSCGEPEDMCLGDSDE